MTTPSGAHKQHSIPAIINFLKKGAPAPAIDNEGEILELLMHRGIDQNHLSDTQQKPGGLIPLLANEIDDFVLAETAKERQEL